jgi:hypothetical protein
MWCCCVSRQYHDYGIRLTGVGTDLCSGHSVKPQLPSVVGTPHRASIHSPHTQLPHASHQQAAPIPISAAFLRVPSLWDTTPIGRDATLYRSKRNRTTPPFAVSSPHRHQLLPSTSRYRFYLPPYSSYPPPLAFRHATPLTIPPRRARLLIGAVFFALLSGTWYCGGGA